MTTTLIVIKNNRLMLHRTIEVDKDFDGLTVDEQIEIMKVVMSEEYEEQVSYEERVEDFPPEDLCPPKVESITILGQIDGTVKVIRNYDNDTSENSKNIPLEALKINWGFKTYTDTFSVIFGNKDIEEKLVSGFFKYFKDWEKTITKSAGMTRVELTK